MSDEQVFDEITRRLESLMGDLSLYDLRTRRQFALALTAMGVAACDEAGIPEDEVLALVAPSGDC